MLCGFVSISLVGFLSNYFYQSSLQSEITNKSEQLSDKLKAEWLGVIQYLEKSGKEVSESANLRSAIMTKSWEQYTAALKDYRFRSVGIYGKDGDLQVQFRRSPTGQYQYILGSEINVANLPVVLIDKLRVDGKNFEIVSDESNADFYDTRRILVEGQSYFLQARISVKKSYLNKVSQLEGGMYLIRESNGSSVYAEPETLRSFLAGQKNFESIIEYRGVDFAVESIDLTPDSRFQMISLAEVESLTSNIGRLHLRIFLICILIFVISAPLLYFLAYYLSSTPVNLNKRLDDFLTDKNSNLLPLPSEDEFGSIVSKINRILQEASDIDTEMESRVLESVVTNQKLANLKKDLGRLTKDYLVARSYRRQVESILSGFHHSQAAAANTTKYLSVVSELVNYLEEQGQHRSFLRKHSLQEKTNDLMASMKSLLPQSLNLSESLIDQLWFLELDGKTADDLDLEIDRLFRFLGGLFPKLKVRREGLSSNLPQVDFSSMMNLFATCIFLVGKQSRDGNELSIQIKSAQDKNLNTVEVIEFQLQAPVSFEISDLDFEGQQFLKMMESESKKLRWALHYSGKNRSKVMRFKFQFF